MTVEQTLRVTSIRSQNPRGFGGCIFAAKPIDDEGRVQDATRFYVVKATASALGGAPVEPGQWRKVTGETRKRILNVNGHQVAEIQVEASSAVLVRPSGEHIVAFLAENPAFEGIGYVRARRLWETLGESLYSYLDAGDVTALAQVLAQDVAETAIAAWSRHGDSRTLQWLQAEGFDLALSHKVIEFFGTETVQKLEEDPYRLLSFCATWGRADALARLHFKVALDDPRRLQGAMEEACYRVFAAGHTFVSTSKFIDHLQGVLGEQSKTSGWRKLIQATLSQGQSNGSFVIDERGLQPIGAFVMERQVARAVADRLTANVPALVSTDDTERILVKYEKAEGIELNSQQRHAVHLAASRPFILITGGAGVGKTTVLKALYEVYDCAGISITQLALAGRAAKRMHEATGRPASTIANFLHKSKDGSFDERCAVVIDESSMIDIITMNRLCELLGPRPRLVLVGDPAQLMPVGPGLVLHALTEVPAVPVTQLTVVKRYGDAIAAAATSIREGSWPALPSDTTAAIALTPCDASDMRVSAAALPQSVLRLYRDDPTNTQILCATRNGVGGTKAINILCQAALTSMAKPVKAWDERLGAYARVGFNLGDPVICTRNLWDRGLQNGSIGVVVQVEDQIHEHGEAPITDGEVLAWVDWDDQVRRPIVEDMLDDLELGYAITVHKAQGSQWPRVIVPLVAHRFLDRTLIYTAITRAQRQVVLVGDETAAKAAVLTQPRSQSRAVSLDRHLGMLL